MASFAYLFERFPSFSQTFCYREIVELNRQGCRPPISSIRQPKQEPPQDWDPRIVEGVHYLPEEAELLAEVRNDIKKGKLTKEIIAGLDEWGRRPDFLRLYQAVYVGIRLREGGIRHVHAHFAGMAARTAFWIDKFFGLGFSFTAHANDIFMPRTFEVGLDRLIESAKAVVAVSDYAAGYLKERFPGNAAKIHRVYNGLDLAQFRRADFSSAIPSIIAIGRLIEKKGFADLIRAGGLLKDRGQSFHCQIIGEGPLQDELLAQIAQMGLQDHLVLTGPLPQKEIARRLASAYLLVLPCVVDADNAMDNLPTVIVEAMAAGLPVISTPVGGVPEMVVHEETGILVPPHDSVKLAEAIGRLIADGSLARRLGERGRKRAEKLFLVQNNVRSLVALFEGLQSKPRAQLTARK
jgi:colanic acid/amylovoran biosynthesis glycosyltransferase